MSRWRWVGDSDDGVAIVRPLQTWAAISEARSDYSPAPNNRYLAWPGNAESCLRRRCSNPTESGCEGSCLSVVQADRPTTFSNVSASTNISCGNRSTDASRS